MNKFEKSLRFIQDSIQPGSPFYGQIYLVGGCVRDELLGERYSDLDLLVNMPGGQRDFVEYMCQTYPDRCRGPFYYQRYGTTAMDVIIDDSLTLVECVEPHIEEYADDGVTLLSTRFCTLEEDSSRRDYTCNALYKNLHTGQVLDPTGRGLRDLREGLLITPSEPGMIYRQDPVRMLRGIRFKHQKGFRLDSACWHAIVENAEAMSTALPKRLRDELNKMLKARTFGEGIEDLRSSRLLQYVMPGMEQMLEDRTQLVGAEEGVSAWRHTRMALSTQGREHPHTDSVYKLACLMMDIARLHGREVAGQLLFNAGIGKEKVASILHITELYQRFSRMYDHGKYVASPRTLPHFKIGLAHAVDDFRRLVRALNTGLLPEYQLPWRIFYDDGVGPSEDHLHRPHRPRRERTVGKEGTFPKRESASAQENDKLSPEAAERKHRRNIKRREQRKRARSRSRYNAEQSTSPQSLSAEE